MNQALLRVIPVYTELDHLNTYDYVTEEFDLNDACDMLTSFSPLAVSLILQEYGVANEYSFSCGTNVESIFIPLCVHRVMLDNAGQVHTVYCTKEDIFETVHTHLPAVELPEVDSTIDTSLPSLPSVNFIHMNKDFQVIDYPNDDFRHEGETYYRVDICPEVRRGEIMVLIFFCSQSCSIFTCTRPLRFRVTY